MPTIKAAVIQLDSRETLEETLENLEQHIKYIKHKEAPHLVVLPELWPTGFNKQKIDRYFKYDGEKKTLKKLASLSRNYKVSIVGSLPHRHDKDKKFNAIPLIVFDRNSKQKQPLKWYHKMALFTALQEDTELGFSSGREVNHDLCGNFPIVDIPIHDNKTVRVGLSICGELRYPEQFYAYMAHKCRLLINCSQWRGRQLDLDTLPSHFDHWEPLLKSRAIESQCYVLGVNRIGREGDYEYEGASMLIDPNGGWVKPKSIEIVPNSRYGEKIKNYEIPAGENDVSGANDFELRRELAAFWFWESTACRLWDFLTFGDETSEMFAPFARSKPQVVDEKLGVVVMPLQDQKRSRELRNEINSALKPYGFENCITADEIPNVHIPNSIFEYIQRAGLIIADITGLNSNVLYEIGLAHALRKHIIIIREMNDPVKVPFDINHIRHLTFVRKQITRKQTKFASNLGKVLGPSLQSHRQLLESGSIPSR